MLNATKLYSAGAEGSKNPFISGILDEVLVYNSLVSPTNLQPKANQLQRICQVGAWYCCGKPPQPPKFHKPGGGKNAPRWAAIKDILEQVAAEVDKLGLRMLSGPADFKQISSAHKDHSYWLELADPQHRPGFFLAPQFAAWSTNANAIANKISFWDHIGTDNTGLDDDMYVKYYPELIGQTWEFEEHKGRLRFDAGVLLDDWDDPWDTFDLETYVTGKGWAVFVVSPTGTIFGGTHEVAVHHHSSFLGGGMVSAAGEMACFDGIPRFITAKSGHYKPTPQHLQDFVMRFPQIRGDALIMPGWGAPKFYTVADFRAQGTAARVLSKAEVTQYLWIHPKAASNSCAMGGAGFKAVYDHL